MLQRIFYLLLLLKTGLGKPCPTDCICDLDDPLGRTRVTCDKGGLEGPLDLTDVARTTEVLIYTAPEDNLNSLMIGPIFGSLKKVEEIHITRSNIPEIGEHSFWRLPSLEVLNLRENNISTILTENFRGIMNLEKLYLDENRIDRLTSGTFIYLENLRVLSLSNNRIEELVTRSFEKLEKLQELNLNGNRLLELNPEVFVDIQGLKILQCRSCGLKTINNAFFHLLPELQFLDFGENDFKYIAPDDFTDLPNLLHLWLDVNKISAIPQKAFSNQKQLKKLHLARNRIDLISGSSFQNLINLVELNLGRNHLKKIDSNLMGSFGGTLEILDLSGNYIPIVEMKVVLRTLKKIKFLNLAEMNLSELVLGLFDFNRELTTLNLAGNYFSFLPIGALSPVPKLKSLDISRNKLKGLDEDSLLRLQSIEEVKFNSNPWSCYQCYVSKALEKMNTTIFLQNIICKTPPYLKGRSLGGLKMEELEKCSIEEHLRREYIQEGKLVIFAAGAGILLLLITVILLLAGVFFSRRHARHYYTHEEKRNLDHEPIGETTDLVFIDNPDISFQFPLVKKESVIIIDDLKKDLDIKSNGT